MRRVSRNSCKAFAALVVSGICAVVLLAGAQAASPKIDLIEPFLSDLVLIHFDTEANLTYELQVTETLMTNGVPGGNWTNLYVALKTPFPNHYVVVDTRASRHRFYRLHVFP